jgi:methyl halide transferase
MNSGSPEFWTLRYETGQTRWDLAAPSPCLVWHRKTYPELWPEKGSRFAVLGCGYGHDAAFLGQCGYRVTGFDIVPAAIAHAKERYGEWATFKEADIFQLEASYTQQFDGIFEHTCFCAIQPSQREAYLQTVRQLLKPSAGALYGVFWMFPERGGPPYGMTPTEFETIFREFKVIAPPLVCPESIAERHGQEYVSILKPVPGV